MNSPIEMKKALPNRSLPLTAKSGFHLSRQVYAFLFLLPALLLFSAFAWYPILKAVAMSFQDIKLTGASTWIGLDNYRLMLRDPAFKIAWENSLLFATWSICLGYLLPVFIALLIREMRQAQGFFRIVYFLPTVVPVAISIIVWRFMYDPDAGFLNAVLLQVGAQRQQWLQDAVLARPSIVAVMTWASFGTTALIYLSSLQEIPTELYEAAELDGANPLQRIRHIAFPHLLPVMSLLFVFQVISVMQVFTEPFLLTNGGPGRATLTPALHVYNRAFINIDLGYASAWSVTMIAVLLVFSLIYRTINQKLVSD